jgi:hypothetical protein
MADTPEDFQARVKALAEKMEHTFPLDRGEVRIRGAIFSGTNHSSKTWVSTDDNKASQLWLKSVAAGASSIAITPELLEQAEIFFGLYWYDEPGTGKHQFLDNLRGPYIKITIHRG